MISKNNFVIGAKGLGGVFGHDIFNVFILVVAIFLAYNAFKWIFDRARVSWGQAKAEERNPWVAVLLDIAMGFGVIVLLIIVSEITMPEYVNILRPIVQKIVEFLGFIWDYVTNR